MYRKGKHEAKAVVITIPERKAGGTQRVFTQKQEQRIEEKMERVYTHGVIGCVCRSARKRGEQAISNLVKMPSLNRRSTELKPR